MKILSTYSASWWLLLKTVISAFHCFPIYSNRINVTIYVVKHSGTSLQRMLLQPSVFSNQLYSAISNLSIVTSRSAKGRHSGRGVPRTPDRVESLGWRFMPLLGRQQATFTGWCATIGRASRPSDADQWPENSVFPADRDWSLRVENWRRQRASSIRCGKHRTLRYHQFLR